MFEYKKLPILPLISSHPGVWRIFMAWSAVTQKCGETENMTIFFRVGFCVFQAWGCKVPSRNIRQFFWKIYRWFLGLGLVTSPKDKKNFLWKKINVFRVIFSVFWWSLYSLPSNQTYQLRTKWKWDLLHLQLH